jgi:MscS family membrane protein
MLGWIRLGLLAGLLLGLLAVPARAGALQAELDAASPAATLRSFESEMARVQGVYEAYRANPTSAGLMAVEATLQRIGRDLFDLSQVPPAIRAKTANAVIARLADILARLPPIPPADVPGGVGAPAGDPPKRWAIPGTAIRLVRVAEGPEEGRYLVSAETVDRLPHFYNEVAGDPVLRPELRGNWTATQQRVTGPWLAWLPLHAMPEPLHLLVFGSPAWKLLAILAIALLVGWLTLHWARIVQRRAARLPAWRAELSKLSIPGGFALLVGMAHLAIQYQIIPSAMVANAETILVLVLLTLAGAWAASLACWAIAEAVIASPAFPDKIYDAHLVRLVARVASLLAIAGVVLQGANEIGVPALGLLASVSIGGIAVALAAQSTLENLFGGISIFADKPFHVGDSIRYGEERGVVESIGPRSTRIRAEDGALMTVPNADLAKTSLVNVSARSSSLVQQRFLLPEGLHPAQIEALLEELRRVITAHPLVVRGEDEPRVRLLGFAADQRSLEVEVFARIATAEPGAFLAAQEALMLRILGALEIGQVHAAAD